ncbi:MAG: hybrid sensor histidine kinase/response regulator [Acidiferrobacterales bacterium]|nr:hybrid sensor histidine kinase/response regulator [Acidiferrobacterales bacterium]
MKVPEPKEQVSPQREIERQALAFLNKYALPAFLSVSLALTALSIFIYRSFNSQIVYYWLAIVLCLLTTNLKFRQKIPFIRTSHETKLRLGIAVNIVEGFLVSSCLLFFPGVDNGIRMLMITLLLVTPTGAISTTLGYRPFYLAFTTPIFISIITASVYVIYARSESESYYVIIFCSIIIALFLYQLSTGISNSFKDAFAANLKVKKINHELEKASNQAKQANESKTRFLASASHDLRQPINVLSLFVANLSLKDSEGEYSDIIGHMNTAINSIDAQLESLLDISKLDAGVVDVKPQEVNLAKFTEDLVSSYPDTDKIEMRYFSEIEDLVVDTDIALLERILNNLVSNSVKYTNEGYIEVSLKCDKEKAYINIKDTGIGIKPKDLENIFDEFYQVDNAERSSANGLGLGLSIVKRLTNLLNIEISMTSQYGLGTQISMSMPYKRASKPNVFEIEAASIASDDESKRVLVLDNELGIVLAVKAVLETMNHKVETFTNSSKALRCFENRRFDLALIDYRLAEGVLGDDVISRMFSINRKTKFFLVTGDNNVIQHEHYEIIHKPVTSKKLEYIFST